MTTAAESSEHDVQPLAGIRVVELATGVSGPYAGKLLADFGAEVVKVEPPDGDPSRREGVRAGPRPEPESSPLFLHLNTNKRSVVASPDVAADVEFVRSLLGWADVVLHSDQPGTEGWLSALARLSSGSDGLDEIRSAHPALVVTSVTPYGLTGPYAALAGSEIVTYALGGPMLATGDPDREPMKLAGRIVQYHAGAVAAVATLSAVSMVAVNGEGTHVEVSNLETQAASIDRRLVLALGYQFDGRVGYREGGGRIGPIPAGVYPNGDGYCQIVFAPNWMPRVAELLGDEELSRRIARPDWYDDDEVPELLNTALFMWTLQRTKQEAMEEAQALQLAITPLNSTIDVLDDKHFRERAFWQRWDHPVVGPYEGPGPQFRMDGGWQARRRAPLLGEHTEEVRAQVASSLGLSQTSSGGNASVSAGRGGVAAATDSVGSGGTKRLPLEGVRVLDLTVVWAGPLTTTLLGDLGAEIVRLDNPNLFPTATRGAVPRPAAERVSDLGQFWGRFPDGELGERPWNRVGPFVCHARNKLGMTIDLRTELGRETFLELVEQSDVLVENNSIRVLPSLGLGWEELHDRNPRLIMVRMPSLGLHGPYAEYVGFGAHMEALCGYSSLRGYRDLDPTSLDPTYFMDPASGVNGAFAALCALRRRERTGVGELIEFAQAENLLSYVGEFLVDASLTGEPHECHGNRDPHRAPQGVYRCVGDRVGDGTPGAEQWVALSVADDDQWRRLVVALGSPSWAIAEALATEAGRRVRHDLIDSELAVWAEERTVDEVVAVCRSAGVSAGPVLDEAGLFADGHLRGRGFFRVNQSADVPPVEFPGHQWGWDGPELRWGPLNTMGGDNDYLYRTVLGKTDDELAVLDAERHLADGYRDEDGRPL
jgi:crotonobetainyl-CoA:carnitine CoA-transferase CaiB-like acyl-CoA transferase